MKLVWLLGIAPVLLAASSVEGTVVNKVTGTPVKKGLITLRTDDRRAYQTLSDGVGHFQFDDVAPGQYQLASEAQGFVHEPFAYVASRRVAVAADQRVKDVVVRMTPFGVISGRVTDENGDPIAGATVSAMRYRFQASGKDLVSGERATTNLRGEFRLFDVEPGPWLLKVQKGLKAPAATGQVHNPLPEMDYAAAYYPSVLTAAEAEPVAVAPGAQVSDLELRLRKTRVFHVLGKVTNAPFLQQPTVRDIDDAWSVRIKPDGAFDIAGFPSGRYRLVAEAGNSRSAIREVTVANRDVDGVAFRVEPGATIEGAVDGIVNRQAVRVVLERMDEGRGIRNAEVRPDGAFSIPQVPPQRYRVAVRAPDGTYLKSVRFGTQDLSDDAVIDVTAGAGPLALTLASDVGMVTGVAATSSPAEAPVYVVLAPSGARAGRVDWVAFAEVEDPAGAFEIDDVPPGEYRILGCETNDVNLAQSEEFRKAFEGRSELVTVRAGEKPSVRLKVIPAAEVEDVRKRLR